MCRPRATYRGKLLIATISIVLLLAGCDRSSDFTPLATVPYYRACQPYFTPYSESTFSGFGLKLQLDLFEDSYQAHPDLLGVVHIMGNGGQDYSSTAGDSRVDHVEVVKSGLKILCYPTKHAKASLEAGDLPYISSLIAHEPESLFLTYADGQVGIHFNNISHSQKRESL